MPVPSPIQDSDISIGALNLAAQSTSIVSPRRMRRAPRFQSAWLSPAAFTFSDDGGSSAPMVGALT